MIEFLVPLLNEQDDPALWQVAVEHILAELSKTPGMLVEIGRCSHWLRPHQTHWTADGGFAWPVGYGGRGYSRLGLPQFDWSVVMAWTGERWEPARAKIKGPAESTSLRITIPSRTTRHQQAAIHTLWKSGSNEERRFYGFRKKEGVWRCTAESDWQEDRQRMEVPTVSPADDDPACRSEEDWLACTNPKPMLDFVRGQTSIRKMRLFAVACCHRIWTQMSDERSRTAVEVSERFADSAASVEQLAVAHGTSQAAPGWGLIDEPLTDFLSHHPEASCAEVATACAASAATFSATSPSYSDDLAKYFLGVTAKKVADAVYAVHGFDDAARTEEQVALCWLMRDVFGNPFRSARLDVLWLTPTIVTLVNSIYAEHSFHRMPALADALEAKGCMNTDILAHCKGEGPHVRGCWVVDMILGKE
ncbi:MAG: hypothetical protein JWL69_1283 [Phycisphaerales bacterium]|nr:hypothetical protein [Phycisphaerales bacterium]